MSLLVAQQSEHHDYCAEKSLAQLTLGLRLFSHLTLTKRWYLYVLENLIETRTLAIHWGEFQSAILYYFHLKSPKSFSVLDFTICHPSKATELMLPLPEFPFLHTVVREYNI